MTETAKRFTEHLEANAMKFQANDLENGNAHVKVGFRCDNMATISIHFSFDGDDDNVSLKVYSIAKVPEDKYSIMTNICSEVNRDYRWICFYLDNDLELTAQMDGIITPDTAVPVSYELMQRMVNIVDNVYHRFMQALWS